MDGFPYRIHCISKPPVNPVNSGLRMSRKSVLIGPLLPDNRVWTLIMDNWEIAIQTLDRFLALR
jgi:hypothetical protein